MATVNCIWAKQFIPGWAGVLVSVERFGAENEQPVHVLVYCCEETPRPRKLLGKKAFHGGWLSVSEA